MLLHVVQHYNTESEPEQEMRILPRQHYYWSQTACDYPADPPLHSHWSPQPRSHCRQSPIGCLWQHLHERRGEERRGEERKGTERKGQPITVVAPTGDL